MSALAALQRRFLEAVVAPEEGGDARLDIYRRGVRASHLGALCAAFPVVRRLVGDAFFEEAARAFAMREPSRSGDLNAYGAAFPGFLARYPHARGVPPLADVARLEWAIHECRHAADGAQPDFAALAALDPRRHAQVRFRLHPAARLVRSPHPILAVWEANQSGRDGTPDRPGPDRVLVRREGLRAAPLLLDEAQWALAAACARGASLGEAAELLGAAAHRLPRALARLAAANAFGACEAPRA